MGKKTQAKKIPKYAPSIQLAAGKEPKIGVSPDGPTHPVWRLSQIDWDGPWCPSKCKESGARQILERLAQFESMSWVQIKSNTGSHTVGAENIMREARQRLTERKLDEWADHLTSLRMSGKQRLWGFLRAGIFHVLWWDPEHEVFPSKKKHT
ncbi:MAG: hypothetical protein WCS43_00580 [Verrucomicrobiota bacterium]